ncbi:MAG: hypothetical protein NWE89_01280 [Candidatus Bathyarchaeota archaeon]|nr:hypothetical protein [Candidatus Bathyarchaeota archaeon]
MGKPLFVVPDRTYDPPRRYMVKDEVENVLYITDLGDNEPERTATIWAMKMGGWLTGLVKGGNIYSDKGSLIDDAYLMVNLGKPLYVVPDTTYDPPRRLMVMDEDRNVLFMTTLNEKETEQSATHAAQRLGGWLRGAVKKLKEESG